MSKHAEVPCRACVRVFVCKCMSFKVPGGLYSMFSRKNKPKEKKERKTIVKGDYDRRQVTVLDNNNDGRLD